MKENVHTEEYYIASIDLLGIQETISRDNADTHLNKIKNIYSSWINIAKEENRLNYDPPIEIRFFSDNVVIAIKTKYERALDRLLMFTAYMSEHFLECKYKPRGGVVKGDFYIDDKFVWGKGLVEAYRLENEKAKYPRIIIHPEIVSEISDYVSSKLISHGEDFAYLRCLESFGTNSEYQIKKIDGILEWVEEEMENLQESSDEDKDKIIKKNEWLKAFLKESKERLSRKI